MKNIQVVILAGGFGTRLGEETIRIPKPMVLIGEKPILWHIMKMYTHHGYHNFIICLGYKGEIIKEYFFNYKMINNDCTISLGSKPRINYHNREDFDKLNITLVNTGLGSQTGSRVKQIEKYIKGDTFMLTYGDGLSNVNIHKLLDFHRKHGKIATVTGIKPPARFGDLIIDGNRVIKFSEKPQTESGFINGGFFVFNKKVFDYIKKDENCFLEKEPLENLAKDKQLMVYKHADFWRCVDTLRELNILNELWKENKAYWKVW